MSLSDILRQYAVESGELSADDDTDHTQMGAEEITVITDETQTELEEAVEEMAETVEKLENNDASAEKLVEATESLESAVRDLRALRDNNIALNGPAVGFYLARVTTCLEAREIPAQIYGAEINSLQASFESNRFEDYSTEAEEKTEGVMKRMINMLVAAYRAFVQWLKDAYQTFGKSGAAIKASGAKLKRISGKLKGTAEGELKGKSYKDLLVGGNVDAVKAMNDINAAWKDDVLKLTQGLSGALKPLSTALAAGEPGKLKAAAESAAAAIPAKKSFALPGGYTAEFAPGEGEGMSKFSGLKFEIKRKDATAPEKVAPLSSSEISSLGTAVEQVGANMISISKSGGSAVTAFGELVSKAEAAFKKADKATPEELEAAREVVKATKAAMTAMKGIVPKYVAHMGNAAKVAYKFGMASAAKHKGAPKGEAGAGAGGEGEGEGKHSGGAVTPAGSRRDRNVDRANTSNVRDRKNKD